ncbi:MAG: homoserine dehydrogenase [Vicinamibacteria bacterium]|nr:homoserine dehydrogenase [Vicinamibacteria bacterium]
MNQPLIVLKFGSSVLRTAADLPEAVHEIYRYSREGFGVVAVVSAFEGVTDRLIAQARELGADPARNVGVSGLAALVASGERKTAAALQIALSQAGIPAQVADPLAIGLRVDGDGLEGAPVDLGLVRLSALLQKGRILVVPGFFGSDEEGGVSLLGRGGSDWTALYLAQRLDGRCRLLKDTDGIYERDPHGEGEAPLRFERLSYEDALALHAPVVQEGALRFALVHRQTFEIARIGSVHGTTVGHHATMLPPHREARRGPLRVTLLGLGAVGRGVYEHLRRLPEQFEIAAIAVRDRTRHESTGVPGSLLLSLDEAGKAPTDVVIEAIGGVQEAGDALARALSAGRHVVTANKAVMAARGPELRALAEREDSRLLYSAAVGGVVPVIETLRGVRGSIASVEGVLNGTSNFVLDRLAEGVSLDEAVAEAQRLGYAETDPSDDLSGLDAARKLALIARDVFGVALETEDIPRPGVSALAAWRPEGGRTIGRLIAGVRATVEGCVASVELVSVDPSHALARCRGANNAVAITLRNGEKVELSGGGAGRWPTAESVVGDLLELWRDLQPHAGKRPAVLGEFEAKAS